MEELQPQELEELVQELERENGAEESLSAEFEGLLQSLQPAKAYTFRRRAAKRLGAGSRCDASVMGKCSCTVAAVVVGIESAARGCAMSEAF